MARIHLNKKESAHAAMVADSVTRIFIAEFLNGDPKGLLKAASVLTALLAVTIKSSHLQPHMVDGFLEDFKSNVALYLSGLEKEEENQ
jgi:hypothetical protein